MICHARDAAANPKAQKAIVSRVISIIRIASSLSSQMSMFGILAARFTRKKKSNFPGLTPVRDSFKLLHK
jgi:hypothetical protein